MKKNKGMGRIWFLLFASSYTLISVFLFIPFITYHLSDSFSFFILCALFAGFFYIYSCFTEIAVSLRHGLCEFFHRAYSGLVGFHFSMLFFVGLIALSVFKLQSLLSGFLVPSWGMWSVFAALVLISLIILGLGHRFNVILSLSSLIVILVLLVREIFREGSYFVFAYAFDFHPETLIIYSIIILVIALFPLFSYSWKVEDPIENLPDIMKSLRLIFCLGFIIIGFLLLRAGLPSSQYPVESFIVQGSQDAVAQIVLLVIFLKLTLPPFQDQLIRYSSYGMMPKSLQNGRMPSFFLASSVVFGIIASSFVVDHLLFLSSIVSAFLMIFLLFILGLPVLRIREPDLERPYQVKFFKFMPPIMALFILIISFQWALFDRFIVEGLYINLIFFCFSSFVYLMHTYYYNERMHSVLESCIFPILWLVRYITLPLRLRKRALSSLGDLKGKTVYEYGCKAGDITFKLLDAVGPEGAVLASDKSKILIWSLEKKIKRKKYRHAGYKIMTFNDKPSSVNPRIPRLDVFVSLGSLAFIDDIDHFLKEMNLIMPLQGKIALIGLSRLFFIFPVKWLGRPEDITNTCIRTGFLVTIEKRYGILGQYSIITGTKYQDANYLESWYSSKINIFQADNLD